MVIQCKKCGGFVYFDSMYKGDKFLDFSCLMCGRRWFVDKNDDLAVRVLESRRR
jgi:predicted  nucleic acid-binding Zn-ribbon protein